jgi:CCR4-NOT transcription complex subunit 3
MASILKAGLPQAPRPPALPPIRYAAAAAAAVSPTPNPQGSSSHTPLQPPPSAFVLSNPPLVTPTLPPIVSPLPPSSQDQLSGASSSPSLTHPSATSPMLSSASVSHQPDGSFYSGQESPALSEAVPSSLGGPAATSSPQRIMLRKGASLLPIEEFMYQNLVQIPFLLQHGQERKHNPQW